MVLKNKEDCSFSAFHGLFVPRAPRSGRRRGHFIKKVENSNSQLCPFELLASLANELLQDTRSSTALNDASKRHDQPATGDDVFRYKQGEENLLKVECVDEGRCKEIVSIPEFIASKSDDNCNLTESSYTGSDLTVQHYSGSLEKINHGLKPVIYNSQNSGDDCFSKVDTGSLISEMDVSVTDGFCRPEHSDDRKGRGLVINDIPSANDPARSEMEFLALINEDNNVEVPLHRDPVHNASTVRLGNDLKLGITDDDENFRKGVTDDDENCRKGFTDDDENLRKGIRDDENFRKGIRDDHENFRDDLILGCRDDDENFRNDLQVVIREDDGIFSRHNKPSTRPLTSSIRDDDEKFARGNNSSNRPRAFRHLSRGGARRIKNLLSSKCWKSSPKWKDCELSKVAFFDGGMNPLFRKRKIHHSRERYLRETLKRRKLSNRRLVVTSGGGFSSKRVFNSPENRMHVDKNDFASVFNEENEMPSPTIGQQTSFSSKDSHVKFCIKSFRIPELLIEVPETTTVGSLKRTVMETLTAVLGSSLHVGMLLHGKKVRDDNRTLLQTGMTSKENLDTLGFTLEPTVCTKNPIIPLSYDTSQLASRSAAPPVFNSAISDALPGPSPLISSGDNARGYHELASACADKLSDKKMPGSRALVSVAAPVSAYSCGMVPVNHRTRQPEHLQRRARRPFSVPEVEKLVQAVERFGTGRWRDVKLLYFETAEHRTYVDLKDKWKTLVHTAQIPPQQRRGEPVPQELLDRVLAAHAYWSLQQAKQQYTN